MRNLALLLAALPVGLLAYAAWGRLLRELRADAKETAALKLADNDPSFARAYAQMQAFAAFLCSGESPWHRAEHGSRSVYILRGGK